MTSESSSYLDPFALVLCQGVALSSITRHLESHRADTSDHCLSLKTFFLPFFFAGFAATDADVTDVCVCVSER